MSVNIVLQQMIIIFLLIAIGFALFKRSALCETTSRELSSIIVNFCNPALLICSVFDGGPKASGSELLSGALLVALAYALLFLCCLAMPYLLQSPKQDFFVWRLLTVYGNVGFIGIPLASAVLGPSSLVYVSINNLFYNVFFYSHGMSVIKKAAGRSKCPAADNTDGAYKKAEESFFLRLFSIAKSFVNAGTVSAAVTILLYLCDFSVPAVVSDTLTYIGRSTTFLSMLVLGVSAAQTPVREVFRDVRLYFFAALRMLLLPVAAVLLFRLFPAHETAVRTTVLLLCVPAGNMPLILARQYGIDPPALARGILLTTLTSLVTIPLVTLFV